MEKKKLFTLLFSLLFMFSFCGSIYGLVSVSVQNDFETGIVDISIAEYMMDGQKEVTWEDNPLVLPGAIISKIPRITNDGNNCYVRAKITFKGNDKIDDAALFGMNEKWLKADDGYYYYTEELPHGEQIDLFAGLEIPVDLPAESQGQLFYIDIAADAIQSKNFNPDFRSAAPWGSVEIMKCDKSGQYDVSSFKQSDSKSFQIVYQGDIAKLISNYDDFFANIPYLMPGDAYGDAVSIRNNGNEEIKIYFRSNAEDDSELLDKIQLAITTEIGGVTKTIYQGSLRAEDLKNNVVLGKIPAGEKAAFRFDISVPKSLNNHYTIQNSFVKWIFSTEPIVEPSIPQTGDSFPFYFHAGVMVMSLMGLGILLVSQAKRKDVKIRG